MWRAWLAAAAVLGGTAVAGAEARGGKEPLRIRVPHLAGTAVRRAVLAAKVRLDDVECRRVFWDFRTTAQGLPLHEVLDASGRTAAEHLDRLVFKDGSGRGACASANVLAYTSVGSDTVHVCAPQFTRAVAVDPLVAEIVLIHELLHTLGLGENPPTSGEITARVSERCGPWRRRPSATADAASGR
jgi:hypothetical protein